MPEETVSCDPNDLMDAARCYKCIPTGTQNEVIIYLLNSILGTNLTPEQLMEEAKCYKCIPKGAQAEVQTFLLCQIVNSL